MYIKIYSFRFCRQRSFPVRIFFISWQPLCRFFTMKHLQSCKVVFHIQRTLPWCCKTTSLIQLMCKIAVIKHCNFYCVSTIINMFRTQKWDTGQHSLETNFPSLYWFDEWYPQRKHTCLAMSGFSKFIVNNKNIIHCNANVKVYVCVENFTM